MRTILHFNLEEAVMNLQSNKLLISHKIPLFTGLVSLALLSAGSVSAGTIVGSRHDLSAQGW